MFWFVTGVILALVAISLFVSLLGSRKDTESGTPAWLKLAAPATAVLAVATIALSTIYTQDEGEARAMRSFTGELVGSDATPGLGYKAPWVKAISFDTRNNIAAYVGDGNADFNGGRPTGNQISFTDKDSAAGNIDVVVQYSIVPEKIEDIYREYKTQENFRSRLIEQDIRATVRTVPATYSTVEVLTQRAKISDSIQEALAKRWEKWGVTSVSVALQEIRYPDAIMERFSNLTAERTRAEEAKAATVTAKETAAQRVAQARGEAEANALLEKSLTPAVLENRRIEMLKSVGEKGNLIITDGKATPLISVDTKK